jgi:hypothetical protein
MDHAERLALIAHGKDLFYFHGRGCFVHLRDGMAGDEDRYASPEEIKAGLGAEPDAKGFAAHVVWAISIYDPIHEAVLIESLDSEVRVLIVRADDAEEIDGLEFSATPTH